MASARCPSSAAGLTEWVQVAPGVSRCFIHVSPGTPSSASPILIMHHVSAPHHRARHMRTPTQNRIDSDHRRASSLVVRRGSRVPRRSSARVSGRESHAPEGWCSCARLRSTAIGASAILTTAPRSRRTIWRTSWPSSTGYKHDLPCTTPRASSRRASARALSLRRMRPSAWSASQSASRRRPRSTESDGCTYCRRAQRCGRASGAAMTTRTAARWTCSTTA